MRGRDAADALRIQRAYPRIFHACHEEHPRAGRNRAGISARDAAILAHLDPSRPASPAALARHLGVGAPTMSAALASLERRGLVTRSRASTDARRAELRLTPAGADAIAAGSVLSTQRVLALVASLPPRRREAAISGLEALAVAALALPRPRRPPRNSKEARS